MNQNTDAWRELIELKKTSPSPLAFRALLGLLETWPNEDQAEAISYAGQFLSTWPDSTRQAPWSHGKAASKGDVMPTWPLVRCLQGLPTRAKGGYDLAAVAHYAGLENITDLSAALHPNNVSLALLYHRPEVCPSIRRLQVSQISIKGERFHLPDLVQLPQLKHFEILELDEDLHGMIDATRVRFPPGSLKMLEHVILRAPDLIDLWNSTSLPHLKSLGVIIRSPAEALALAQRKELARIASLTLAFRCGWVNESSLLPFLGYTIEPDEDAANSFFRHAKLNQLRHLEILGVAKGTWCRQGLGSRGLRSLVESGLLSKIKSLALKRLPLGDEGLIQLAPLLGPPLEKLELVDLYFKDSAGQAIAQAPCMSTLTHLDLSANHMSSASTTKLAQAIGAQMQSLNLSGPSKNPYASNIGPQPIGDDTVSALMQHGLLENCQRLILSNCSLTDDALTCLFESSSLPCLAELDLSLNCFSASAIEKSVVLSSRWNTLSHLQFNACRLDDSAIESLCKTPVAPALRSLGLKYNRIGPRGASALANWPALNNMWMVDLYDNAIGDQGVLALAQSPYARRLLELNLEQDSVNSQVFTFGDHTADALAHSSNLSRLDCLLSGCIDEYYGFAFSPGFSKKAIKVLRNAKLRRPAFRAACGDFSGVAEYMEFPAFGNSPETSELDFRGQSYQQLFHEADPTNHPTPTLQTQDNPSIQNEVDVYPDAQVLHKPLEPHQDIIEGIEYMDAKPMVEHHVRQFRLPLNDPDRPLPFQIELVLERCLESLFFRTNIGYFQCSGGTGRQQPDGSWKKIDTSFNFGFKGDPQHTLTLIRESLWWLGAPASISLDEFPLAFAKEPDEPSSHFLQLCNIATKRWDGNSPSEFHFSWEPFSLSQRVGIQQLVDHHHHQQADDGWVAITTEDQGSLSLCIRYLHHDEEFEMLNIMIGNLTPKVSSMIYRLLNDLSFIALPMAFAPSQQLANHLNNPWPKATVVKSPENLHQLLFQGPYTWWKNKGLP